MNEWMRLRRRSRLTQKLVTELRCQGVILQGDATACHGSVTLPEECDHAESIAPVGALTGKRDFSKRFFFMTPLGRRLSRQKMRLQKKEQNGTFTVEI